MGGFFKALILGAIAGAIATVTVHELITLWLLNAGYATRMPWLMDPSTLTGLPQIAEDAGLGAIWGALFGLILGSVPKGSMTIRGALLGLIGPGLIGSLVVQPLLSGSQPVMITDPNLLLPLWPILLAATGFGLATAWLYGFFSSGCRLP